MRLAYVKKDVLLRIGCPGGNPEEGDYRIREYQSSLNLKIALFCKALTEGF
jgi:hypothetical protein